MAAHDSVARFTSNYGASLVRSEIATQYLPRQPFPRLFGLLLYNSFNLLINLFLGVAADRPSVSL